jgi:hypothetical protein
MMSYQLRSDGLYMMPTHFGPSPGLRQTPDGGRHISDRPIKVSRYSVPFVTRPEQLEALLPPDFLLSGDPVVTVDFAYQTDIPWLAGRGYNIVMVRIPAAFRGTRDQVSGQFITVLWENMADPIISGREQLGFSKIFADIENPQKENGGLSAGASWEGFEFLRFRFSNSRSLSPMELQQMLSMPMGDGLLHYKYIPATGEPWRKADAAYATLTPFDTEEGIEIQVKDFRLGEGELTFNRPTWEQMPTQNHIVGTLCNLDILEYLPAYMMDFEDNNDLRGQRRLR